jgi:hypothetical protein
MGEHGTSTCSPVRSAARRSSADPIDQVVVNQGPRDLRLTPPVLRYRRSGEATAPRETRSRSARRPAPLLRAHGADLGLLRGPCPTTRCGVESIGPELEVRVRRDQRSADRWAHSALLLARQFSTAPATSFVIDPFPTWIDEPTQRRWLCHLDASRQRRLIRPHRSSPARHRGGVPDCSA